MTSYIKICQSIQSECFKKKRDPGKRVNKIRRAREIEREEGTEREIERWRGKACTWNGKHKERS